jgi:hypothetical protein
MIKMYTTTKQFKTLRPSDPDFHMDNGIVHVPRAAFEISRQCPDKYASVIQECINYGWLKPVAYLRDTEYTMELLRK